MIKFDYCINLKGKEEGFIDVLAFDSVSRKYYVTKNHKNEVFDFLNIANEQIGGHKLHNLTKPVALGIGVGSYYAYLKNDGTIFCGNSREMCLFLKEYTPKTLGAKLEKKFFLSKYDKNQSFYFGN